MSNKKCIHIWVNEATFAKLQKYASENSRSLCNATAYILENLADDIGK